MENKRVPENDEDKCLEIAFARVGRNGHIGVKGELEWGIRSERATYTARFLHRVLLPAAGIVSSSQYVHMIVCNWYVYWALYRMLLGEASTSTSSGVTSSSN